MITDCPVINPCPEWFMTMKVIGKNINVYASRLNQENSWIHTSQATCRPIWQKNGKINGVFCLFFFRYSAKTVNGKSTVWHICSHTKTLLMVSLDLLMLPTPIQMLLEEFVLKVICLQPCELELILRQCYSFVMMACWGKKYSMRPRPLRWWNIFSHFHHFEAAVLSQSYCFISSEMKQLGGREGD